MRANQISVNCNYICEICICSCFIPINALFLDGIFQRGSTRHAVGSLERPCSQCFHSLHNISVFFFSDSPLPVTSRVCFVKFHEPESVGVSQHLTNTVFVDRALIVVPFAEGGSVLCFYR